MKKETEKVEEKEFDLTKKAISLLSDGYICDSCLGRSFAELLSGFSNDERGRIVRNYIAFVLDSGKDIKVDPTNFYDIKFRNVKLNVKKPKACRICNGFFPYEVEEWVDKIIKKIGDIEYDTFLIGTIVTPSIEKKEEMEWDVHGKEFSEPLKGEVNREVGKLLEKKTDKKFETKEPHLTITIDFERDRVDMHVKSLYIYGKYSKLARGIPQTKWICRDCHGKGCIRCEGVGKMYESSVQEIIEKPLLKAAKAKSTKLHGSGREDVDARCLGKRPFIIELLRPKIRSLDLKEMSEEINESEKVQVYGLKLATKRDIEEVKKSRYDKTYVAQVTFSDSIDKDTVPSINELAGMTIRQRTPHRVSHRRSDLVRKRKVRSISVDQLGDKELKITVKGEAGLYIKELISGDDGRTEPNVSDIISNKVKKIELDVVQIHC